MMGIICRQNQGILLTTVIIMYLSQHGFADDGTSYEDYLLLYNDSLQGYR